MQDSDVSKKHKKFEKNYNQEVKILPQGFDFESNIVITKKKLIIHNLGSNGTAIVIQNSSAIKSHSELFKLV
ncbi:MAG TPA: hypothetical protein EYG72_00850 [Candidatus Pacebacteria bacterium]|nr:hypothetical protein [Candidatus Paceibacterota bacterium]